MVPVDRICTLPPMAIVVAATILHVGLVVVYAVILAVNVAVKLLGPLVVTTTKIACAINVALNWLVSGMTVTIGAAIVTVTTRLLVSGTIVFPVILATNGYDPLCVNRNPIDGTVAMNDPVKLAVAGTITPPVIDATNEYAPG